MKKYFSGAWVCGYYGNDARKLCFWMYDESDDLFLKRKKMIFDNYMKQRVK